MPAYGRGKTNCTENEQARDATMIDETEREDFRRAILDNGMDPDDFELIKSRDEATGMK